MIAAIALYIAYQQWQTNRRKLDIDLYDRRLAIYQAVDKFVSAIVRDLDPKLEDFYEFRWATAEADFLFGPDIREYLEELTEHSLALRRWQAEYRHAHTTQDAPPDYDHAKVVRGQHKEAVWFAEQHKTALQRFGKYMNLWDVPASA